MSAASKKKDYRFSREDFGPLQLAPLHYDLLFDVRASRVRVVSRQTYICNVEGGLSRLELNAHDLDVASVQIFEGHSRLGPPPVGIDAVVPDFVAHVASLSNPVDAAFQVDRENRKLFVDLEMEVIKK